MKPKLIHQQAMDYSFKAKQASEAGNHFAALGFYEQAAGLESEVAEFYFDKPELEPTRSTLIRSAAFLNLKAGQIERAKKFIFFGLLNSPDSFIKSQLNNALEFAVSLGNMTTEAASEEYHYISLLRQRSIHYSLEPTSDIHGKAMSWEKVTEFSTAYLKSLKAFAVSKFRQINNFRNDIETAIESQIEKLIDPVFTSSAYGSFKFSVANDFLQREGESSKIRNLKADVISKYHNEIFINPLTDIDIKTIRKEYGAEDINAIFRPLSKIKAANTPYKIAYYNPEDFEKKYVKQIINSQRKKLITVKPFTAEDIGELQSLITHRINLNGGKVHTTTIFKEQLKTYEFEIKTNQVTPGNYPPLILSDEILLSVAFAFDKGFTISFEDLDIEYNGIDYLKTLQQFYNTFYEKLKQLANNPQRNSEEQKDWIVVKRILGNPDALKG